MKRSLFVLVLLVGLLPLLLNSFLLLDQVPNSPARGRTVAVLVVSVLLLVLLAGLAASWLSRQIGEDLVRFRNALWRMSRGNYRGWMRDRGSHREVRALGFALNRLAGNLAEEELLLQREEEESREVATQSLEFIEELLKARVPLAKHHPGLIEAYSRELVEGKRKAESEPQDQSFVRGVMDAVLRKGEKGNTRRGFPRYLSRTLWVEKPVPARIIDLSVAGMCIESLTTPQGEASTVFTVVDGDERLEIPGNVQWCKLVSTNRIMKGERVAVYRAGIAFISSLSLQLHERLLQAIEAQFGLDRAESR
jgi:hypothetical protein